MSTAVEGSGFLYLLIFGGSGLQLLGDWEGGGGLEGCVEGGGHCAGIWAVWKDVIWACWKDGTLMRL